MARSSIARIIAAGTALAVGALAELASGVAVPISVADASTTSGPGFCTAVAFLPNSPRQVALHWPILSKAPTHAQDIAIAHELGVLESALSLAAETAPTTVRGAFSAANTATTVELRAVAELDPSFNSSKTYEAIAGYLSTVHRQATLGSSALSSTEKMTKLRCRTYVGTSVAQQFATDAANYATQLSRPLVPTRGEILTGAANSGHAVSVLAMTSMSGNATRVKYGVIIIYRTDYVCVTLAPTKLPLVVAC